MQSRQYKCSIELSVMVISCLDSACESSVATTAVIDNSHNSKHDFSSAKKISFITVEVTSYNITSCHVTSTLGSFHCEQEYR